jgi:hypothetical protein
MNFSVIKRHVPSPTHVNAEVPILDLEKTIENAFFILINQMNKFIQFAASPLVLFASIMLSGCSNGPSESDAKKAVQASLGNCEYLSIGHFEKVNGTPQGDGRYLLDIKYSIKMKPTPDIKAYASEKYAEEVANLKQQVARAHEIENAWKSDQQAWIQANAGSSSSDYEVAHKEGWDEYQKVMPLLIKGDQLVINAPRDGKAAMERAIRQSCPNVAPALLNNLFNGDEPVEQYASGIEQTFTGKVAMVKTDNGWQEDR